MKLLSFMTMLMVFLVTFNAEAIPLQRLFQDIKLPTQAIMEHYSWSAPGASASATLKLESAVSSSSALTITSFLAQPDVPRNILLQTAGTGANVGSGTATVTGTNIHGKVISETFSVSAGSSASLTGNSAFASVTSVVWPQASGSGVRLSVGIGTKLGLNRCMDRAGEYVFSEFNNAYETTRGTIAINATGIENNTFIPNGVEDGLKRVDLFYIQNFRCFPGQ